MPLFSEGDISAWFLTNLTAMHARNWYCEAILINQVSMLFQTGYPGLQHSGLHSAVDNKAEIVK